jgi:hypothetical protein
LHAAEALRSDAPGEFRRGQLAEVVAADADAQGGAGHWFFS